METISNIGCEVALEIKQSAPFTADFELYEEDGVTPFNTAGYNAQAALQNLKGGTAIAFACTFPVAGTLRIQLTAEQTTLPCGPDLNDAASQYKWDLELIAPGTVLIPAFWGPVSVLRDIKVPA